jgi:PAS domain S-box-containing protein
MVPAAASVSDSSPPHRANRLPPRPAHIIALIGGLLVLTAVLGCGYFIASLYESEVTAIRNRLEIPAHAMAHSVDAIARNADAALRNIQTTLESVGNNRFSKEALHQLILYRNNISIAINRIAIYDANGEPYLSSVNDPPHRASVADYAFFRRQAAADNDRLVVSDLVADPVDGKAEIVLSRRIIDRGGKFVGVAAVFIDAQYLQNVFDLLDMPIGTSITAFNRDGHILVRTPPVHLGDPSLAIDFSQRPIFSAIRDGAEAGRFAKLKTVDGVDRFVASIGGKELPFVIAAGWDTEAALASWRKDAFAIGGATVVALAIALALLAYLSAQIGRNEVLLTEVSDAEQRQRNLMTALPDAVAIINDKLRIEFANPAAERIHGYGPGEMTGLRLADIVAEDKGVEAEESARQALVHDEPLTLRVLQRLAKRKDGSTLPVEISTCRYRASDGWQLISVIRDVTVRQANDLALRRSRENLSRAQRIAAIGSFDRDLVACKSEWSEEFRKIWGIEGALPEDPLGYLASLVHPEDREKFMEGRAAALRNEPVPALDFRITRPDGEVRVLHREYGVIFDDTGRATRLFGTVQDVTERKNIENELRRSREDLARAQQIAALGSFSRDLASGKTEWSEQFLRIWGIGDEFEQPHADALAAMVHPADRAAFIQGRHVALEHGANASLDFRITRPDGEERILHRDYGIVLDESGKAVRMFGTVQDITERKQIEIELRRSRENLARAQRVAGVGSFERDLMTGKWEWSDELFRIHGLDPDDSRVDADFLRSLVHPEDRAAFDEALDLSVQGLAVPPLDFRIIRPDGVERILHRDCELIRDASGKPIRLVATMQDITERRQVEIELRRSRENMARAQSLAAIGSFDRDLVTGTSQWTDQMFRIIGLDPAAPRPSESALDEVVHPDDRERFHKAREDELAGKPLGPFEYRVIRVDNREERIVRRESQVTFDADRRPVRVFGTLQDITEHKRAETEILRSRENMMRAQRIANMGSFDHDLVADRIEWSDQMYHILGYERGQVIPSSDVTLALVHPEDRVAFLAARARSDSENFNTFEFRITRPDGEERVLRRESDIHFAEDGRPIRVFGTVQDITERRTAEARERELERQLLHSQKLEALGTLAGGIAHDLNNTLVPIMALSKLTARRFDKGTPVRTNLETIYEASERARDLVRRVLAFSRKDEPEQHEANLAEVVREAMKLMRATVPTSIQLDAAIADVPAIRADASQIHQVITNLISNAVGAIANGMGTINVSLTLAPRAKGANDVCLSVADSGCGMDEATMQRIFEPFFTTKAVGQGTGLGLSIVHGIVTSHGGHIEVKSAPGKGTRFDLYFPLPQDKAAEATESSRPAA